MHAASAHPPSSNLTVFRHGGHADGSLALAVAVAVAALATAAAATAAKLFRLSSGRIGSGGGLGVFEAPDKGDARIRIQGNFPGGAR